MLIKRTLLSAACAGLLMLTGCGEQETIVTEVRVEVPAPQEGDPGVIVELDDVTTGLDDTTGDAEAAPAALPEVRYYRLSES